MRILKAPCRGGIMGKKICEEADLFILTVKARICTNPHLHLMREVRVERKLLLQLLTQKYNSYFILSKHKNCVTIFL